MAFTGCTLLLLLLAAASEACQFSCSCSDIIFHGNRMTANCSTKFGGKMKSSLNVNKCVGFTSKAGLDCSSGFKESCTDIEFNGITLKAVCTGSSSHHTGKPPQVFHKPLDECISNVKGKLKCC